MSKHEHSGTGSLTTFSPVRTRRSFGKKVKEVKARLHSDSSENEVVEPSNKRRRRSGEKEGNLKALGRNTKSSRPRTRSLTIEAAVPLSRSEVINKKGRIKEQDETSTRVREKGSKKQQRSPPNPREETTAVRRSERESRKVFDSLNEHTLVRSLIGDYLVERPSSRDPKRREMLEDGETDSQEEQRDSPDYVSMYDMIKSKSKTSKDGDEDDDEEEEEEGEDNEEKGSDDDDDSSEENEDEERTTQKRYKLREKKPVTKRYTAPPLKGYHSSRRGLFSGSRVHMRERECANKEPFSPIRKSYKLKRKTINESSTSTDDDDDDNRKFERRKAKSMAKARNRCLPMNLGLEDVNKGILGDRERIGSSLADVDPMNVDRSITFDSIGGLGKHVRSLKEMVVFPLLYPEVFQKFKVNPPRGVLFHGPPGTGKTLMARALANECSQDEKKVAFFMRKGADCLSKWVGESERQLRLLFDQAFKMRPSIIFFDEIDGLAPVRSSRQDQIHSSIVSTLLALMDGLDNRGEIVVIGATNRIDSIDPALRRPGRFDREFIFPLPDKNARRNILSIHTKAWQPRLTQSFINEVADHCVGYCGADIKALCTEATLFALRRRYPQIYASKKKLVLDVDTVRVNGKDFAKAITTIVPACQRAVVSPGRALSTTIRPLLHDILTTSWTMITKIFPPSVSKTVGESSPGSSVNNNFALSDSESSDDGTDDADIYEMDPSSNEGARVARAARAARRAGLKGLTNETGNHFHCFAENPMTSNVVHRPRYLVCGKQSMGQSSHLSPAILHSMEHLPVHCLDLPALFGCASKTPEEACAQIFREARRVAPSIIYLPRIESLWNTTTETLKATFMSLVNDLPPTMPLLLFATSDSPVSSLPYDLSWLFSSESKQVFEVPYPSAKERWAYFEPLFLTEAVKMPCVSKKSKTKKPLEVLPVAPPPAPRELNVSELQKVRDDEENTLRELRIFLREITVKLMSDRRFKEFYKPVDLEDVPDYLEVIMNPMDLSTMLQKVDGHQYQTCGEYLNDVDQITSNALEYNPNQDAFDRLLRHRACALKDSAHSLIKSQLDLDFEKACEDIAESQKRRGDSRNVCAPKYLPVARAPSSSRTKDVGATAAPAATNSKQEASGSTEVASKRLSRRVRGLAVNVDIPLEYMPLRSHARVSKPPVAQTRDAEAAVVKKNPHRYIKTKRRRRKHRRKSSGRLRKGTPMKSITAPEENGSEDHGDTKGDNGDIGENDGLSGDEVKENEEEDNMSVDGKNDEEDSKDDKEKHGVDTSDDSPEFNKSTTEDDGVADDATPDSKNCINSLHARLELSYDLKSHLDTPEVEYNHDGSEEHEQPCNGNEKECSSETNFSMATSEISNCDSKDVAELDSVLSTSPLQVNGVSPPDEESASKSLPESVAADEEEVDESHSEERLQHAAASKGEPDSVEKSKRVLFLNDNEVQDTNTVETSDPVVEVTTREHSKEDREKFEGLLMELVEATEEATIESLERHHSNIRQCVLQHKKDDSRQPLLEDLKLLLNKFSRSELSTVSMLLLGD